jgi:redox-sensitive bicupin YhaK (pirin superfamily)
MSSEDAPGIEVVVEARPRDVVGFPVRRALPSLGRRHVGPFVFFDHMGPVDFAAGEGMDVRPHPHIGLATVTYLFDGEILHRDSLGSDQVIRPGDVNWMTAGRGIVHSERTPAGARARGGRTHGIQSWVALPLPDEETEPSFHHHAAGAIPVKKQTDATLTVIAGTAYGLESPVHVFAPTLYVHARLDAGAHVAVDTEHAERAAYVVEGEIEIGGKVFAPGHLVAFEPGAHVVVRARTAASAMILGGAPLDGPRHVWWNFVSSSHERIERAKAEWRERRFPRVPGDDEEFIPLPEGA